MNKRGHSEFLVPINTRTHLLWMEAPVVLPGETTSPIAGAAMLVGHRQNQNPVRLNRIDERIPEGPKHVLPNTRANLLSCFRELRDAGFSVSNLVKEPSAQPVSLEVKVADLIDQLFFRCLVIAKQPHRRSLFTFS